MRFFKATYTVDGELRHAASWTGEFRDHNRIARRLTFFRDRRASEIAGTKVERLVSLRLAKEPPDRELTGWLEATDSRIVKRLAEWNIVDEARVQAARPLVAHLGDWKSALLAKGVTLKHAEVSHKRAEVILIEKAKAEFYQDVTSAKVRDALTRVREEDGVTAQTVNYYRRDTGAFCRWMVVEQRSQVNPVACLRPIAGKAVRAEQKRRRRAMTVREVLALLATAMLEPTRFGMTGPERALVYRLAVETGLRASEIASLTAGAFRLGDRPVVGVEAASTKNGKVAELPLRPETAALLREHLANKLPTAKAFNMPTSYKTAKMIREDLSAAGINDKTLDFHCLRHTFITNLANSGVHPKVAQDLARHSDINLTLSRYSHTLLEQRAEAVGMLPDLDARPDEAAARQATTDEPIAHSADAKQDAKSGATDTLSTDAGTAWGDSAKDSKSTAPFKELVGSIPTSGTNTSRNLFTTARARIAWMDRMHRIGFRG